MALLPQNVAWDVIQTSLAVLVYALIVNAFYQVISKRRMFADKADVAAEAEIEKAMADAKESVAEIKAIAKEGIDDEDSRAAAIAAAEESRQAVKTAEAEIKRQKVRGHLLVREFRALVLVPLVGFLFFLLLSANLVFLGAERPPLEIFSLSMAILLAVRLAAYINEPTSHDLAKMLPLALLGFYLIQGDFSGIRAGNEALLELREQWRTIGNFLLLFTLVELVLRASYLVGRATRWNAWVRNKAKRFR